MSSKFVDNTATHSGVDVTKKKTHIAAKKDKPPEILSDIPMYSEINQVSETSAPRNADTAFDNQVYSMGTSDNTYSKLNRTVQQSRQVNLVTLHDDVLGTKTVPHKEKSKKDQCGRNLVWIVISVNILLLLVVGILAVAALVKLNTEIVSLRASLSNSSAVLSQNFSALENKTQILFVGLDSRVDDLYTIHLNSNVNPSASCSHVVLLNSSSPSGHYWIRSSNGSAVRVYCDMIRSCGNITGGWMRVASLDMRDSSSQCPNDLRMVIPGDNCNPEPRICEIGTNVHTGKCSSNSYTSHGLHYSHVCGMIRAYQFRTPDAFAHTRIHTQLNINSNYVDGVSLTHGVDPSRKHIWTFVAGK